MRTVRQQSSEQCAWAGGRIYYHKYIQIGIYIALQYITTGTLENPAGGEFLLAPLSDPYSPQRTVDFTD